MGQLRPDHEFFDTMYPENTGYPANTGDAPGLSESELQEWLDSADQVVATAEKMRRRLINVPTDNSLFDAGWIRDLSCAMAGALFALLLFLWLRRQKVPRSRQQS